MNWWVGVRDEATSHDRGAKVCHGDPGELSRPCLRGELATFDRIHLVLSTDSIIGPKKTGLIRPQCRNVKRIFLLFRPLVLIYERRTAFGVFKLKDRQLNPAFLTRIA
jgi:hypothetical protein